MRKPILSVLPPRGRWPWAQPPGRIAGGRQVRLGTVRYRRAPHHQARAPERGRRDQGPARRHGRCPVRRLGLGSMVGANLRAASVADTLEADFTQSWRETFLPVVHRGQQEFHAAPGSLPEGNRAGCQPCRRNRRRQPVRMPAAVPKATFARFRPCAARWLACNRPHRAGRAGESRIVRRSRCDKSSIGSASTACLIMCSRGRILGPACPMNRATPGPLKRCIIRPAKYCSSAIARAICTQRRGPGCGRSASISGTLLAPRSVLIVSRICSPWPFLAVPRPGERCAG